MTFDIRAVTRIAANSIAVLGLFISHPLTAAAPSKNLPVAVTLECDVVPTEKGLEIVIANPYSPRGNNFVVPSGSSLFVTQGSFDIRSAVKHFSGDALSPGSFIALPAPSGNWLEGVCLAWIHFRPLPTKEWKID